MWNRQDTHLLIETPRRRETPFAFARRVCVLSPRSRASHRRGTKPMHALTDRATPQLRLVKLRYKIVGVYRPISCGSSRPTVTEMVSYYLVGFTVDLARVPLKMHTCAAHRHTHPLDVHYPIFVPCHPRPHGSRRRALRHRRFTRGSAGVAPPRPEDPLLARGADDRSRRLRREAGVE